MCFHLGQGHINNFTYKFGDKFGDLWHNILVKLVIFGDSFDDTEVYIIYVPKSHSTVELLVGLGYNSH